jgi:hypothetical protein
MVVKVVVVLVVVMVITHTDNVDLRQPCGGGWGTMGWAGEAMRR